MELNRITFFLKRLYKNYVKQHMWRIMLALLFSTIVAGTTVDQLKTLYDTSETNAYTITIDNADATG